MRTTTHRRPKQITLADLDRLFKDRDFIADGFSTDTQLEQELLGGLISLDAWGVASVCDDEGLRPEHFRREAHQNIYRALRGPQNNPQGPKPLMLELGAIRPGAQRAPTPPDTSMVCEYLNRYGLAEACGGLPLVVRLADKAAGEMRSAWIIRQMRNAHARRELMLAGLRTAEAAIDQTRDIDNIVSEQTTALSKITVRETSDSISSGADIIGAINLDEAEPDDNEVIPTGIPEIDQLLGGGLTMARLSYLAARPGHGKTALAMNIGLNVARWGMQQALPEPPSVMMCLLEMPAIRRDRQGRKRAGDFSRRLLTAASGVPIMAWQKYKHLPGRSRQEDQAAVRRAKAELSQLPLYTDDVPGISYSRLFANIRRARARMPTLKLVIIDYIGLVTGERGEDEQAILKKTSNGLVKLVNELGLHIICLSQLNRDCEGYATKRPRPSNLRQSGVLEQDADHILMVQRPCKYEEWADHTEAFWIAERKGRHVERSETVIRFLPEEMWIGGPAIPDPVKAASVGKHAGASWRSK